MAGRSTAKPFTGKQQRLVFFLGLVFAVIAAVIVFAVASGLGGSGDGVSTRAVVVAAQDIPADARVTTEMLEVTFVPTDEVSLEAFTARNQVIDRFSTQEVAAGEQIVPTQVSTSAGDGVSFLVEPGFRAISVEVREVVTAGGNLQPGDHVDMIGIFEVADVETANDLLRVLGMPFTVTAPPEPITPTASTTQEGEEQEASTDRLVLTVTLLQDVKLLAIAQSLSEDTAAGGTTTAADETAEAEIKSLGGHRYPAAGASAGSRINLVR